MEEMHENAAYSGGMGPFRSKSQVTGDDQKIHLDRWIWRTRLEDHDLLQGIPAMAKHLKDKTLRPQFTHTHIQSYTCVCECCIYESLWIHIICVRACWKMIHLYYHWQQTDQTNHSFSHMLIQQAPIAAHKQMLCGCNSSSSSSSASGGSVAYEMRHWPNHHEHPDNWQHVNFPTSTAYCSRTLRNHGEPSLEVEKIKENLTFSSCPKYEFSEDRWKTLDNDQNRNFNVHCLSLPWPPHGPNMPYSACCSCCSTSGHAGATTSMSSLSSWSMWGTKYGENMRKHNDAGHEMPWAPANVLSNILYKWT